MGRKILVGVVLLLLASIVYAQQSTAPLNILIPTSAIEPVYQQPASTYVSVVQHRPLPSGEYYTSLVTPLKDLGLAPQSDPSLLRYMNPTRAPGTPVTYQEPAFDGRPTVENAARLQAEQAALQEPVEIPEAPDPIPEPSDPLAVASDVSEPGADDSLPEITPRAIPDPQFIDPEFTVPEIGDELSISEELHQRRLEQAQCSILYGGSEEDCSDPGIRSFINGYGEQSWAETIGQGLALGDTFAWIGNAVGIGDNRYPEFMARFFSTTFGRFVDAQNWDANICNSLVSSSAFFISEGHQNYQSRSGAYLIGRKTPQIETHNDTHYVYFLNWRIVPKKSGLNASIVLYGEDLEEVYESRTMGRSWNSGPVQFESDEDYDEVCMVFERRNLHQYFDYFENERFCQELELIG